MLALIRCGGEPLASLAHPLRRGRSGRDLPPCARGLLRYPARRRPLGVVVPALAAAFPDASRPEKLSRRALTNHHSSRVQGGAGTSGPRWGPTPRRCPPSGSGQNKVLRAL